MLKTIVKCMELRSLPMSAGTVAAGTACAVLTGNLEILPAILTLLFAMLSQICANLFHRYSDEKYSYGENIDDGFAGTSSLSMPLLTLLKEAAIGFGLLAMIIGCALLVTTPIWAMPVGILIALGIFLNSAGPYPLSRRPWNVVLTFIFFGPVGVIGTALVQAYHDLLPGGSLFNDIIPAFYLCVVMGLFAVNSLLYYGYATYDNSVSNASRSFTAAYGKKATRALFFINSIVIFIVSVAVCMQFHFHNMTFAMIVPTLCTIYNFYVTARMKTAGPSFVHKSLNWLNWNMFFYGLAALIEFNWLGIGDDSIFVYF